MRALLIVTVVGQLSCTPQLPALGVPEGCQPLFAGAECLAPYPSDFFRTVDASTPTGYRIVVGSGAAPKTKAGRTYDVTQGHPIDGFSTSPTLVATLGREVSASGFVTLEQGGEPSLSKDTSNTLILDAETGAPVPHFVDLDPRAVDLTRQALVLHPLVGLTPRRRYVVLVAGAKVPSGELAPAPEGFRRLRDGQAASDPALEGLARAFDDRIVPAAKKVGLERQQLQLAWEFTTGSQEWATDDLFRVRELTLTWLDANQPQVRITSVSENPADALDTFRIIKGFISGPRVCTSNAEPGCTLIRGADGRVTQDGVVDFPFLAVIPKTVEAASGPQGQFLFGHGFFGGLSEVEGGAARRIASRTTRTLLAIEWWGMSFTDIGVVGDALTGPVSRAPLFAERVHQGMANWLVLTRVSGALAQVPAFQRANGQPLVTGLADRFMGISQGHILGGTMNAINPLTTHLVFNVGGAGLTRMMMRAEAFTGLFELLALSVDDPFEQQKFIALIQRPLDRVDPATYARFLQQAPLPGNTGEKRILMQVGLMDSSVPNVGSFLHARLLGLPVFTPGVVVPFGLSTTTYPATSGLQVHDFKLGDPAAYYRRADFPSTTTPVHDSVRGLEPVLTQIDRFFRDGQIVQTCAEGCDPD